MNMERVFRKPKLLRTLTTLDPGEFERLLVVFDAAWQTQRPTGQRGLGTRVAASCPTAR